MEKILAKELIDRVKAKLSTFFDSNRANEGMLYTVLFEGLDRMGVGILDEEDALLQVSGSMAELPNDFKQLCSAVGCFEMELVRPVPNIGMQLQRVEACAVDIQKGFSVQVGPTGQLQKVIQHLPYETWSWEQFEVLSLVRPVKEYTADGCINVRSQSQNHIEIKNGKMYTNFESGTVYIQYLKNPISNEGVQVPANAIILNWLEDLMISEVLETLFYNGEPDIQGRLQLAQQRLQVSQEDARRIWKGSEFQDFYNLRNRLMGRYKALANPMRVNEYRNNRPWH